MTRYTPAEIEAKWQDAWDKAGVFEAKRDLITLGAYRAGSDRQVDQAIAAMPLIQELLQQAASAPTAPDETLKKLQEIATRFA